MLRRNATSERKCDCMTILNVVKCVTLYSYKYYVVLNCLNTTQIQTFSHRRKKYLYYSRVNYLQNVLKIKTFLYSFH